MNLKNLSRFLILSFTVLLSTAGCSSLIESITGSMSQDTDKEEIKSENTVTEETGINQNDIPGKQEIAGEWINKDYDSDNRSAKLVYTRTGDNTYSYKAYDKSDGSGNVYTGKAVYKKRWFDDKGNLLGESNVSLEGGMSWETLDRISKDGKTLEVQSGVKKIDPSGPRYSIYYRK